MKCPYFRSKIKLFLSFSMVWSHIRPNQKTDFYLKINVVSLCPIILSICNLRFKMQSFIPMSSISGIEMLNSCNAGVAEWKIFWDFCSWPADPWPPPSREQLGQYCVLWLILNPHTTKCTGGDSYIKDIYIRGEVTEEEGFWTNNVSRTNLKKVLWIVLLKLHSSPLPAL